MKEEWEVKDFKNWDLKETFHLDEVAHLYYEADPYNQHAIIPNNVRTGIKQIYKILLDAARERSLYLPENRCKYPNIGVWIDSENFYNETPTNKISSISIHGPMPSVARDDLRYFFAERLSQKPLFLFPEERKKQSDKDKPFTHSPDYRFVTLHNDNFNLTSNQATVIKCLHEAFKKGTPEVGQAYILENVLDTTSTRLRDTFKSNPNAWKALITTTQGKRGTYRLNL